MPAPSATRRALLEGLADAAGFVLGALAGWGLGLLLGIDFVRSPGYGGTAMLGLVLILAGCGVGKWLSRRWLQQRLGSPGSTGAPRPPGGS
jgi:hypothetical protein